MQIMENTGISYTYVGHVTHKLYHHDVITTIMASLPPKKPINSQDFPSKKKDDPDCHPVYLCYSSQGFLHRFQPCLMLQKLYASYISCLH